MKEEDRRPIGIAPLGVVELRAGHEARGSESHP